MDLSKLFMFVQYTPMSHLTFADLTALRTVPDQCSSGVAFFIPCPPMPYWPYGVTTHHQVPRISVSMRTETSLIVLAHKSGSTCLSQHDIGQCMRATVAAGWWGSSYYSTSTVWSDPSIFPCRFRVSDRRLVRGPNEAVPLE